MYLPKRHTITFYKTIPFLKSLIKRNKVSYKIIRKRRDNLKRTFIVERRKEHLVKMVSHYIDLYKILEKLVVPLIPIVLDPTIIILSSHFDAIV